MQFSFQYFFYSLISLDFAIDFAIFTMWLQACGWTDGQTDGLNNEQTDRLMGGQTNVGDRFVYSKNRQFLPQSFILKN